MNITEEEAMTKVCHLMIPFNSWPNDSELVMRIDPREHRCAASACMAWRRVDAVYPNISSEDPALTRGPRGHCGLAGTPKTLGWEA